MKLRAFVLVVLALVLAGCGGTSDPTTGGAGAVPADAVAFIAFNTDSESTQWQTAERLANRFPDWGRAVNAFERELRDDDVDWDRDVKPALGPEVVFAWLDFDNNGENFVLLMQPDDEDKFKELLRKSKDQDFVTEKVDEWQVLAKDREVIERYKREADGDSLEDSRTFHDAMDSYPDETLFRAFIDGEAIMNLVRRYAPPAQTRQLEDLGSVDWLASDLHVTGEGVRWDFNAHGRPGPALRGQMRSRSFDPALTKRVPADALLYLTFHGSKGMFTALDQAPELRRYADVLRSFESLLQGENALYVRPAAGRVPEITLLTEPARGTNGMTTLDGILRRHRSELELPSLPRATRVAGTPARTLDFGPFSIHYAQVGKHFVITDVPSGVAALKGTPSGSLEQSDEFKGAADAAGLPAKTQGFVYVNVRGGVRYAERLAGSAIPDEVKRNLQPLRSAVEYVATRPSEVQVTFFLRIK